MIYFTYHKIYFLSSWWKFFIYSELCHHPYHLLTEHFITPKRNFMSTHSPLPPAPGNYKSTFCLLICLFWTFNLESQEYVAFCVWFLSLSVMHSGSPMLHHVPVLHSFLLLNNIPLRGYASFWVSIHESMIFWVVLHFLTVMNNAVNNGNKHLHLSSI